MVISRDFGVGKFTGYGVLEELFKRSKPQFSSVK